ncbi:hypothetical protein psyc5s11_16690 [Clostridium gelidum]|uniref:Peptidase M28 domain-containing protein n=2 Tax=Clostridium gelidum TaxID=704125 RepID=A0ABM7T126_9CLOT|nr:hypothetical protein psyc5s11_16690 [Clostridium gelidum]
MKCIFKSALILITIVLSLFFSISSFTLPKVQPANVQKEEFSAQRAMEYVEKIAVKPHEIGSLEHDKVRDYLLTELTNLGLKPEVQKDFSVNNIMGETLKGNIENICARLNGNGDSKEAILMVAHYDSTSGGPGAADDAAGVATLLETIRALKESAPLKNDVIFLISDGEEMGLLGAKSFVDKNPLLKDSTMVMNFEARGNSGPVIMFETGNNNEWFMKEFKKSISNPVAYSFLYEIYKYMPNNTDFTLFKKAGKDGFNFATLEGYETYHNFDDTGYNLNQRTLQHEGNYALSLVKHFGDLSLNNKDKGTSVYFTIAKSVLVEYSSNISIPLGIFSAVLFIVVFIYGLKKKILSFKGTLQGFILEVGTIGVSSVIGIIIYKIFVYFCLNNKKNLNFDDSKLLVTHGAIWVIAIIILITFIMYCFYMLINKKVSYENMIFGSLLLWSILTVVSSFLFKSASYMFLWPTICILAGFMLQFVFKSERNEAYGYLFLMIFTIVSCILVYIPIMYILFECMGIQVAGIIAGVATIPLSSMILSSKLFFEGRHEVDILRLNWKRL